MNPLWKRILQKEKMKKVFLERITEPLHINAISAFVALFGNFRTRVDFDLIIRPQYAFPILCAADLAVRHKIKKLTLIEFGVASGAGLLNICDIAGRVSEVTGVEFRIVGFDTGTGMPPPLDYRDLPEYYHTGDFPMDVTALRTALPSACELVIGDIKQTLPTFLDTVTETAPIGFVSVDVDYYSSARDCLEIFKASNPNKYLPVTQVYLDDIGDMSVNPWVGEALAVNEFNSENGLRKISAFTMLRSRRFCKNAKWIDQIYCLHVLDHRVRTPGGREVKRRVIDNEFLGVSLQS